MIAYVPLERERAQKLRDLGTLDGPLPAHAVTAGLLRAHDLAVDDEDAEYTALAYAAVTALLAGSDPLRLVIAVDLTAIGDSDDGFGRVELGPVAWTQVTSLFADEVASAPRLAKARGLAAGLAFEQVVDDKRIESLLDESDLLWFAPGELDRLPEPPA